jgi:hypothetical protein
VNTLSRWPGLLRLALLALIFAATLFIRVRGIATHFALLDDQIRDWSIALRPFSDLPLVGPPTHVGGYTIGPAFYWILWAIRVSVGPWLDNLPHAGGVGQAILQSGADALLLWAIWRRTQSVWRALATTVLVSTASYDLNLAGVVWNAVVGSTLAKMALALVVLEWFRPSALRVAFTAALAWSAVHAHTGTIYVTVCVLAALVIDPLARPTPEAPAAGSRDAGPHSSEGSRHAPPHTTWLAGLDWSGARRSLALIALAIILLQVPYVAHQVLTRFSDHAMGAVTDSVGRIFSGRAQPELAKSWSGFTTAVAFIQVSPWSVPGVTWLLVACGAIVAIRYRHDPTLLCMTLLPQLMAILGYAFFLGGLDNYYYLSLMPPAVLTVVLGVTAPLPRRASEAVAIALVVAALAIVPARVRLASTMDRMPEYGALVRGSRTMVQRGQPLRGIETEFALPPTSNSEFVYRILGGQFNDRSEWVGVISAQGGVTYRRVEGP